MTDRFYKLHIDIARNRDLTGTDKVVLSALMDRLGNNGKYLPGIRSIALDAGISVPTAIGALRRLCKGKMIEIETRGNGKRQHYQIIYQTAKEPLAVKELERSQTFNAGDKEPLTEAVKGLEHTKTDITQTKRRKSANRVAIPDSLSAVEGFADTWARWLTYRRELKKPLSAMTSESQLKKLATLDNPVGVIEQSIEKGWQGLFPVKGRTQEQQPAIDPADAEEARFAAMEAVGKFDDLDQEIKNGNYVEVKK